MRLSVALATYNGGRFLPAQLASLAGQTRLPDELVAGDDGSTDGTLEILTSFAAAAPFPVTVHRNPTTLGSTRNFDQAIGRCTGDVIFLCDQDDEWHPEKLARFAAAFADPAVGLVASDLELIDEDGKSLGRRMWADLPFTPAMRAAAEAGRGPRLWLQANTVTGAAAAFRTDLRDVIRPIPPCWVHDGWIALIAAAVADAKFLPDPLTRYRVHSAQQIGTEPLGLWRQVRAARRMDAAYFATAAACFDAAVDRLSIVQKRIRDPDLLALVRRKAAFTHARRRMREGWRAGRVVPAARELFAGNYHRFGRAWKGFAADLFL